MKLNKVLIVFSAMLLLQPVYAQPKAASPNLIVSEIKSQTVLWKQTYDITKNKSINIDLNGDKKADYVEVGMDHPNGTKVIAAINGYGVNLMDNSKLYGKEEFFDDYGEFKKSYYMQVSFIDMDNDKKPEIFISAWDGSISLGLSIFKYTGNKNTLYKEIGYFDGQSKVYVRKNKTIELPYGSQGLFKEYKYSKGRFIEVQ